MFVRAPEPHSASTSTASRPRAAPSLHPAHITFTPLAPQRQRRLSPAIAATPRRPVSRDLLDNVDTPGVDGLSGDSFQRPYPGRDGYGPEPYNSPVSGASPQHWDTDFPSISTASGLADDPDSWRPDPQQQQPRRAADSSHDVGRTTSEYGGYTSTANGFSRQPTASGMQAPPPYSAAAAAAAQPPAPSSQQQQQPSQQGQRQAPTPATGGSDWGEPDPITDWGGAAAAESTGWEEDELDAAGASPSYGPSYNSAAPRTRFGPRADPNDAASERGRSSSSSGYGAGGAPDAAWPRSRDGGARGDSPEGEEEQSGTGPSSSEYRQDGWPPGYDGAQSYDNSSWTAAGVRFAQDVRYDDGGYGRSSSSSGSSTSGGRRQQGGGDGSSTASSGWGRGGSQQREQGRQGSPSSSASSSTIVPPSDVVLLSGRDASGVLPLAPTTGQVEFFQPRSVQERVVQYLGSLAASLVLSKAALLAGPALLFPIWSPWIRAGLRNVDLYSKSFACVGLWRAEVLDVRVNGMGLDGLLLGPRQPPSVTLLVGDPWVNGARATLELPYQPRSEAIRPGDAAELLVLCRDDRFVSFKVVREVYLPQSGVWLCDYPFLNRDLFLSVSLAVEQQRRAEAAAAAAASYYTYDVTTEATAAEAAEPTEGGTGPGLGTAPGREEDGEGESGAWRQPEGWQ